MRAIQTIYKGYHFRSRLEARWAVVFDHLDLQWEYEPEGFELDSGRYLPDFYLPGVDTWVEIKGGEPSEHDRTRFIEFTRNVNRDGQRARMLCGSIPDPRHAQNHMANRIRQHDPQWAARIDTAPTMPMIEGTVAVPQWMIVVDSAGTVFGAVDEGGGLIADVKGYATVPLADWYLRPMAWIPGGDVPGALAAGRSARFEHGQAGATIPVRGLDAARARAHARTAQTRALPPLIRPTAPPKSAAPPLIRPTAPPKSAAPPLTRPTAPPKSAAPPLTRPGVAARKFSAASTVAVAMFEKPHLTGTINALRDAGVDDTAIMEALGL